MRILSPFWCFLILNLPCEVRQIEKIRFFQHEAWVLPCSSKEYWHHCITSSLSEIQNPGPQPLLIQDLYFNKILTIFVCSLKSGQHCSFSPSLIVIKLIFINQSQPCSSRLVSLPENLYSSEFLQHQVTQFFYYRKDGGLTLKLSCCFGPCCLPVEIPNIDMDLVHNVSNRVIQSRISLALQQEHSIYLQNISEDSHLSKVHL